MDSTPFHTLLRQGLDKGGFETDDALGVLLPLLRDVAAAHEAGLVAPLRGVQALRVNADGALHLDPLQFTQPTRNLSEVEALLGVENSAVHVVAAAPVAREAPDASQSTDAESPARHPDVAATADALTAPAYLPGYVTWEHALNHHDPLTDILSLGLLLASLSCGLDFTDLAAVERFAAHRANLFALQPRLHPVVARIIVQMSELNRHKRAPDLAQVVRTLENYRDQPLELNLFALKADRPADRRRLIQDTLRDRLFEISRRNRLIYFKPTLQTLNLTEASVPLVMAVKAIRQEHLFAWHPELATALSQGNAVSLGKYLRTEDAPYLPGVLDKIIATAKRDRAEYGFAQLRLVLCFLRWHNLKEAPQERIHSPLLLLPIDLVKRKGVRDAYVLTPGSTEAEINPALRHHLKTVYGITLPESIDLQETSLDAFHVELQDQIRAFEPGVTLEKRDRPQIEVIHAAATQRFDQWQQRQRIRPASTRGKANETANPYHWAFDLCSLTLANFHYRKMTLVRDYTKLNEETPASASFEALFSAEPRPTEHEPTPVLPFREQFPVIPCDSAQAAAIARARAGSNLIIQGPPGTGKSQTITNLIADFTARGRRVLFVCEKRAAIDVVFHRLRQQGLDELCCLIHDSQTDKKEFIQNLKQTYEQWLSETADPEPARTRSQCLRELEADLGALERFSAAMTATTPQAGLPTRRLLHRLVELSRLRLEVEPATEAVLPFYAHWLSHGAVIDRLRETLQRLEKPTNFSRNPLRWLRPELILGDRPAERLQQVLRDVAPLVAELVNALTRARLPQSLWGSLPQVAVLLDYAHRVLPLAQRGQLGLLDPASALSKQLEDALAKLDAAAKTREAAAAETKSWNNRLTPTDTANALNAMRAYEASALRFLQWGYWRLRGAIRSRYDFAQHAVPPTLTRVLEQLQAEHSAEALHAEAQAAFAQTFGAHEPAALQTLLSETRGTQTPLPPPLAALRRTLLDAPEASMLVQTFSELRPTLQRMVTQLETVLSRVELLPAVELQPLLSALELELKTLPEVLPALVDLARAPEDLRRALVEANLELDRFEVAIAEKTRRLLYRSDPALTRFDGPGLEAYLVRLEEQHRAFLKTNAAVIRQQLRQAFRERTQLTQVAATQLSEDQKRFKKNYGAGRRELEHEFGKTMRYRSIRDLATDETGEVVRDLKPIWLMSPLSVSDTLPLDPDFFDVVIFDEASQIPVEEAVPAVYRAKQVIVVGDEMQLPPTTFFAGGRAGEELAEDETTAERVHVDLEADSFLAQSARNLPSTLLAWHYRSRSENLISFSNAAFYGANLFTIPDRLLPSAQQAALNVQQPEQGAANVDALLQRSVSFHFVENGIYEQRRNAAEAAYIAQLVRELLARQTRLSVGIVAFSEAQQSEIEDALDALAEADRDFAARYEAEVNREEDDQFCGLFVKNLENVQGDERDVILLSICYGYDRNRRMLMNFGPINQRGGEKRLNVIFSRARQHMAVVSSIRHGDITNDYNDGANVLRLFLRFAEDLSRGDLASARAVLHNFEILRREAREQPASDAVAQQLAEALRARGHAVDADVGQSRFRCDLAVRDTEQQAYALGILVDTDQHYANAHLVDRYLTRPSILKGFGWRVLTVLTKDWLDAPDDVIARIEKHLAPAPARKLKV